NATIQHAFDIRWAGLSYANTSLYARARSKDWTGNVSAWVQGNDFTFEQVNMLDLGPGSVATIEYLVNGNDQVLQTAPIPPTLLGSVAITTTGKSVDILAKVRIKNTVGGGATEGGSGDGSGWTYLTRGQIWP